MVGNAIRRRWLLGACCALLSCPAACGDGDSPDADAGLDGEDTLPESAEDARDDGDAASRCGDGTQDPGEECDDGNADDHDNCLSSCLDPTCGDGFVWTGHEECDDGDENSNTLPDACRTTCVAAWCGDGVLDTDEGCDDGNAAAGLLTPFTRDELRGRPLDGGYVVRFWDIPELDWGRVEDAQVVLKYRYWTPME